MALSARRHLLARFQGLAADAPELGRPNFLAPLPTALPAALAPRSTPEAAAFAPRCTALCVFVAAPEAARAAASTFSPTVAKALKAAKDRQMPAAKARLLLDILDLEIELGLPW